MWTIIEDSGQIKQLGPNYFMSAKYKAKKSTFLPNSKSSLNVILVILDVQPNDIKTKIKLDVRNKHGNNTVIIRLIILTDHDESKQIEDGGGLDSGTIIIIIVVFIVILVLASLFIIGILVWKKTDSRKDDSEESKHLNATAYLHTASPVQKPGLFNCFSD